MRNQREEFMQDGHIYIECRCSAGMYGEVGQEVPKDLKVISPTAYTQHNGDNALNVKSRNPSAIVERPRRRVRNGMVNGRSILEERLSCIVEGAVTAPSLPALFTVN
ncbi:hypothetical protein RRG08_005675 [Elysia crispata]|uniref:Uncharacterized protein n=1 Tax=Elysia crispata TaxID=231223 RepID=A0AAE0YDL5_9GAST|nr:hypothetical protein RRG08_005675 [Elysia crispata]